MAVAGILVVEEGGRRWQSWERWQRVKRDGMVGSGSRGWSLKMVAEDGRQWQDR